MGLNGLPKVFIDDPAELPSAAKWNGNFDFLNFVHDNLMVNGDFEDFPGAVPQSWILSGTGATSTPDADSKRGTNAAKITFGSTTAVLKQSATEFKFFQGRKVKAWVFVKTSFGNQARIRISDGLGSSQSAFHTGGGAYELLEVIHTMAGGATELTLELEVATTGSALFDAAMLVDFDEARGFIPNASDVASLTIAAVPSGISLPFNGPPGSIPSGYLEENGQAVSRVTFSVLFGIVGTAHGEGDGSTTFNVPDKRGKVPRGMLNGVTDTTISAVDTVLDQVTATGHGLLTGHPVKVVSTGAIPGGLDPKVPSPGGTSAKAKMYVIRVDADTLAFAATRTLAFAGTRIVITSVGSGVITLQQFLDPDVASREAPGVAGNTGDAVGSVQEDEFFNHQHGEVQPVGGAAAAGGGPGVPNATLTSLEGGNETRMRNDYVLWIIKT